MNIAEFLNTNTQKFPTKGAVGFKKKDKWKEIHWLDFRRMVFKTANALQNVGIVNGDKVAIYADNSPEWIVFDLAILSLGAITVPIYSTSNQEQAAYIIDESESKLILVGSQEQYDASYKIVENSSFLNQIVVSKKSIWIQKDRSLYFEDFIKKSGEKFEIIKKEMDDLATIIYTSGTTGVPKGVMLTHGNFQQCFSSHFDFFKFKNFERETSLAFLPLTHIFERSWTLLSLYGGAKVYFLENTKHIANALLEVKPTMMCAVPRFYQKIYSGIQEMGKNSSPFKKKIFDWSMATGTEFAELKRENQSTPIVLKLKNKLAQALVFDKVKKKMGGNLWFMPCGGASISSEVTQFFEAMGIHITVGYGLTETTATLTAFPTKNFEYGTAGIPIGNTQIKIGENEEILVKGSGIMQGYYKKPIETAEVFTEDGWFKTGDSGKFDDKGNLLIVDRIKDLMKTSNGKYIAPQPIENLLSDNSFIDHAMIVAEGKPYVTAVIIPNFESLKLQLEKMNIAFTSWDKMVELDVVKEFYRTKIDDIQKGLTAFEKVKKFVLMSSEFEINAGEITPTLKVKRNVVLKKYHDRIEQMYSH